MEEKTYQHLLVQLTCDNRLECANLALSDFSFSSPYEGGGAELLKLFKQRLLGQLDHRSICKSAPVRRIIE